MPMFRARNFRAAAVAAFAVFVLLPRAHAWDSRGHSMINFLAVRNLPADAPGFLRTPAALAEIEYLGPEPDRWRSPAAPELSAEQSPEHFIDLELADALGPLPHKRLDFEAEVFAAHERPEKIGLQPWAADEVWERLTIAMRQYRNLKAAGRDTAPVQQVVIFYAGWLGHYVGDGSQPLHTTIEFNGWIGPNPHHYETRRGIHHQFETFAGENISPASVQANMTPVRAIHGDMFDAYVAYLRVTHGYVDELYQLEKNGGYEDAGRPETRAFAAQRLAAGASMLRDMIYSAWLDSATPVP